MTIDRTDTAPPVRLVRVHPQKIEDVLFVLSDAASWLIEDKGIDNQWPAKFAADNRRATKLREEAEQGNVRLMCWQNTPLATATFTDWADPDFAHAWPDGPENAVYVIRLAVTRLARAMGLRLGEKLLDLAAQEAGERTDETGAHHAVRLDCSRVNTALHAYYERCGFTRVGTVDVPGRRSGALFERPYDPAWRASAL